jgi:type II secretion system protein G
LLLLVTGKVIGLMGDGQRAIARKCLLGAFVAGLTSAGGFWFAVSSWGGGGVLATIDIAKACVGSRGPIGKALEAFRLDMGRYPTTSEGLEALFISPTEGNKKWKGPYLDRPVPDGNLKDPWGQPFEYRSPGMVHKEKYDLWSRGPDRTDDGGQAGSDDIKNWIEK